MGKSQTSTTNPTESVDVVASTETTATETSVTETVVAESSAETVSATEQPVVDTAPVVTAAPVVEETSTTTSAPVVEAVTQVEVKQVEMSQFEAGVAEIKANGSSAMKAVIQGLEKYMASMKPGMPVDPAAGAAAQYDLWKIIYNATHLAPATEFKMLWNIILAYFNEYQKGVFNERYVFRFSEAWQKDKNELDAFQRILNLIKLTADPATRKVSLKQVDLDRTLSIGFNDEARKRILNFYMR